MSRYQTTLHGISERATSLLQLLGPVVASASPLQHNLLQNRYHLTIPLPQPVTHLFIARGHDSSTAVKLNEAFLSKALSLKQIYEEKYRQAFKGWVDGGSLPVDDVDRFISAAHTAYIAQYDQAMAGWHNKMDELSRRRTASMREESGLIETKDPVEGRPTFKNVSHIHFRRLSMFILPRSTFPFSRKPSLSMPIPVGRTKKPLHSRLGWNTNRLTYGYVSQRSVDKIRIHHLQSFRTEERGRRERVCRFKGPQRS